MADITKTLEIVFNGIDKGAGAMIDGMTGKFDSLSKASQTLTAVAEPFDAMATHVLNADKALAAFAIGGIVASFTAAKNFETAVIDLDKVLENSEGLETAKQYAKELGQAYGESATAVLTSIANFKQAGFDITESMQLAKNAMDLVRAGGIDAAEASDKLVAILKGFNAPASDAGRVLDILNEVSNKYATNVRELADGMALVSPIAKAMGFSFEETAGMLTPIIEVFRSGTMSAEGLKTGLLKLVDDSKPVVDALESLHINQRTANGELKSGKEILQEVASKFSVLSKEQQLYFTSQLVGLDQAPKMQIVFSDYAKVLGVTKDALNSAGSAQREVDKQLQTSETIVDQLMVAFENLGITVGGKFREQAKSGISGITEFIQAIDKAAESGAFAPILNLLKSVSEDIGKFFRDLSGSFPEAILNVDFTGLIASLKNIGESVKKFFEGFDPSDPEKVQQAMQDVVDAITFLVNTTKGMADTFEPIVQQIIQSIKDLSQMDTGKQELFGNILGAGKLVVGMGAELLAALATIQRFGVDAADVFDVFAGSAKVALNSIQAVFDLFVIAFLDGLIILNQGAANFWKILGFDQIPKDIEANTQALYGWRDAVGQDYQAQIKDIDDGLRMMSEGFGVASEGAETATESMADFRQKIDELVNAEKTITITANGKDAEDVMAIIDGKAKEMEANPTTLALGYDPENYASALAMVDSFKTPISIATKADEESVKKTAGIIKELIGYDDDGKPIWFFTDVNQSSIESTKQKIKDEIPTEKILEIKLQGEIDKEIASIKATADTAQKAFEWTAKVDIAEIEASSKALESMFGSINTGIQSTSSEITKLLAADWDNMGISQYMENLAELDKAQSLREKEFELQEKLIMAQINILKTKNDLMKNGKGLIKIDSTGLEPALETILWQILQKVQLQANEDSANFLLGI